MQSQIFQIVCRYIKVFEHVFVICSVGSQEASAIPFAALTAWRALKSTARITKGYAGSILQEADGIIFSRGNLGIDISPEKVIMIIPGR